MLPLFTACNMNVNVKDIDVVNDFSATQISVTSPGIADGITPVTITIVVRNKGVFVVNYIPTYHVTGSGNTALPCTATNSSGVSICLLRSTVSETKTITLLNPAVNATETVVFNPFVPAESIRALSSGGGITTGGTILSHSTIGLPLTPILLESSLSPGTTRVRTGVQGVLHDP